MASQVRVIEASRDLGWYALTAGFNVSVIVWLAALGSLRLVLRTGGGQITAIGPGCRSGRLDPNSRSCSEAELGGPHAFIDLYLPRFPPRLSCATRGPYLPSSYGSDAMGAGV